MANSNKTYFCSYCKKTSEIVKVEQHEVAYYSLDLSTDQWEDFAGDRTVESQKFYCVNCDKRVEIVD